MKTFIINKHHANKLESNLFHSGRISHRKLSCIPVSPPCHKVWFDVPLIKICALSASPTWMYQRLSFCKPLWNTLKARFYGNRFSWKPRFSGQWCYDGTAVFSNSGNFNIMDTFGCDFCFKRVAMTIFSSPFKPDDCKQFKTNDEFEQSYELF